jgi:hypothetical protein
MDVQQGGRNWLRVSGGAASFAGFVLANEAVMTFGVLFMIPLEFAFGVMAVWYLPILTVPALTVLATVIFRYSAFEQLDMVLTLALLYPVAWILHRARVLRQGWWWVRAFLVMWTAGIVYLLYAGNPLIRLLGSEYDTLQDLELLQPIDFNEDYAVFAAAAAVLLAPAYTWWRYAAAQHMAAGLDTWGRHAKWGRSITRGIFFLMVAFGAEVFNLGWRAGAPLAIAPLVIETYEHRKKREVKIRGNRVFAWLHTRVLWAVRSQLAGRIWSGATAVGRALLTLPALVVLAATSFLLPITDLDPVDAGPPMVHPVSAGSSDCVDQMVNLTVDYGVEADSDLIMEQEADKLRGDNVLSVEQYEFVKRLRAVTKDRFAGPDTGPAERRWSYEYVRRIAGKRCNGWYPAPRQ